MFMKQFVHFMLVCLLGGGPLALWAQSQVTLRISEEGRLGRLLIDTTFTVEREINVDELLEEIKDSRLLRDRTGLNTVVVIRDLDKQADEADVRPEDKGPRPMIGVYLDSDHNQRKGVRITRIISGSGAADADLQPDDLIVAVNGQQTRNSHDIGEAKTGLGVGDRVTITYLRDGEPRETTVELRAKASARATHHEARPQRRGFLGVYTDEVDARRAKGLGLDSQQGVYLEGIVPGSGAEVGGLQTGDVITGIDGRALDAAYELSDALEGHPPGDTIAVRYWRAGQTRNTQVVLTERIHHTPRPQRRKRVQMERAYLGVYLEDHRHDDDPPGVKITRVVEDEAAEAAGLQPGDRILSMQGEDTPTYDELEDLMGTFEPGERVVIRYLRDGQRDKAKATLGLRVVHRWVTMPEAAELPAKDLVKDMPNQEQASQLRDFMESPSLEMETFELFPNPSDGRFTLRFRMAEEEDTDVRIFTTQGQEIYRERRRNFSGDYERRIDLRESVSEGIYFLQVTRNGRGMVERLLVSLD